MALTLPKIKKNNIDKLTEAVELISDKFTDQQKADIKDFKYKQTQRAQEKQLRKLMFAANHPVFFKAQQFVSKGFVKLMKMRWFDKITGFFKNMLASTSGWLETLFGIIILLKTGILQEAIPWLLQIAKGLVITLIKWTPTILKFVWNIITRTLPALLKQIFNAVFDTLGLPKDHPIRKFFNYIFDNFGPFMEWLLDKFKEFLNVVGKLAESLWTTLQPVVKWSQQGDNFKKIAIVLGIVTGIVGAFLLLAKLSAIAGSIAAFFANVGAGIATIAGFFSAIGGVLATIGTTIAGVAATIAGVVASIGLIPILIIAGIVALGVLLFVFRKQIWEFFSKTLPKWFGNFVGSVKNFIFKTIPSLFKKAADFILRPIKNIFEKIGKFFEPLYKFFNSIKDMKDSLVGGAGNLLESIKGGAKSLIENPKKFILDLFNSLIEGIKKIPKQVLDAVKSVFNWVIAFFGLLGEMVIDVRKAPEMIKNFDELMKTRTEKMATADALKKANERAGNTTTSSDSARQSVMFGRRAKGGSINAGEPYLVGEKGPELVVPSNNGNVTSNNDFKKMIQVLERIEKKLGMSSAPPATFAPFVTSK